ncbi:MAG: glycerol-3-phosphate acyltransferase [Chloroflexi bacterium]|nr:glycerol-3-phosphate acyltransferase [Chloroflexota bacterium]
MIALWTLVGFLLGSLPFSVWLGKLVLRTDIRGYGDGNPGGTNVIRAGNRGLGLLVIILDMLKGAVPVALAHYLFKVDGWPLAPVMLAPILGHAFSPFLSFRGGKALASTFGAWTALTVPFGPFVMGGSVFVFHKLLNVSAWAVIAALLALLGFLMIAGLTLPLLATWAGTVAILAWTHRADLRQRPALRPKTSEQSGR